MTEPQELELAVLERPVLGWCAAGITAAGILDVEIGGNWEGRPCRASCPSSDVRSAAIWSRGRSTLATEHRAPMPFCYCGLRVHPDAPDGRWRDMYRDRLGFRMRTAALAVTWGRVIVEQGCVRGEHGLVLALTACADDSPPRRRRARDAARLLGAEVIEIDPIERPDFGAIAERMGTNFGQRLGRDEAVALLRRRDLRRWRTLSRHAGTGLELVELIVLGGFLAGGGLTAAGLPVLASAAIVVPPSAALAGHLVRHTMRGMVQVEALAMDAAGRNVGEAIGLAPPRFMVGRAPAGAPGDLMRDAID